MLKPMFWPFGANNKGAFHCFPLPATSLRV